MKKLHKLLLGAYIGPFFITFFIVLFILIMQFLWLYIDELVGKGIEWYVIIELLFYASAHLVPMALPVAILLSSIMAFGNLGENYELVALKSSGLSLMRIMKPLTIFTVFTAFSAFYFANNIWPVANLKFKSLLYDIQHTKPAIDIKPGVFYKGIDGYVIKVGGKDEDGQTMYDMLIYDHTKRQGASKVIRAEKGKMFMSPDKMYLNLILHNGYSYDEVSEKELKDDARDPLLRFSFNEEIIRFNLSGFQLERTDEEAFTNNYQMMNIVQLDKAMDTLYDQFETRKWQMNELQHDRFVLWRDSVSVDSVTADIDSTKTYLLAEDFDEETMIRIVDMGTNLTRSSIAQLGQFSREYSNRRGYINKHRTEWHRKFTIAFSCIILFFIGAPLGAIIRKGGFGLPVVVAIIGFLIFYMLNIVGEKLVKEDTVVPFVGMWLSSLVLFPVALFLTYKATTDSALFEGSTYVNFIRNLVGKISLRSKVKAQTT